MTEHQVKNDLDPLEPLKREPEEIRKIVYAVLELEQSYLNLQRPHINDDVIAIVKREIK